MPIENFALYSKTHDALPDDLMQAIANDVRPAAKITKRKLRYTYRWPDLTIRLIPMPALRMLYHLPGLEGYVYNIYEGKVPKRGKRLMRRINQTRLVVGIEVEPHRDEQGRTNQLFGHLNCELRPIVFHGCSLFDWRARLLLALDTSFDPEAEIG